LSLIAVQIHPISPILVLIESAYMQLPVSQ